MRFSPERRECQMMLSGSPDCSDLTGGLGGKLASG